MKRCKCDICKGPLTKRISLTWKSEKLRQFYVDMAAQQGIPVAAVVRHAFHEYLDILEQKLDLADALNK